MSSAAISCPWCSKAIDAAGLTAGARVQCPRCQAAFTLRPEDLRAAAVVAAAPAKADAVATKPAAPKAVAAPLTTPEPALSGRTILVIGAGAIAALLLVGVVIGAILLAGKKTPQVADALSKPPAATPPAATSPSSTSGTTPQDSRPDAPPDPTPPPKPRPEPRPDYKPTSTPPLETSAQPEPLPTGLSPQQEEQVKKAIDHGIAYLEKRQQGDGSWPDETGPLGAPALAGLTLLECGVPADDPHVLKTTAFVRKIAPTFQSAYETYELALAILFLDRLGDSKDEQLIRTLALRIIAAQTPSGGWSYNCPRLRAQDERSLLAALRATRPTSTLELMTTRASGSTPTVRASDEDAKALAALPPTVRLLPGLSPVPPDAAFQSDATDNSCTQFAILALWTARRHDVPMERALSWVNKRFRLCQDEGGGWNYSFFLPPGGSTPSMTAAGLLGVAVGHGVTADLQGDDSARIDGDPAVERGMKALAQSIGKPLGDKKGRAKLPPQDLYFLWSVERAGVLYHRNKIADKEWYPWGAEILLDNQLGNGSWQGGYGDPIDTSFALLFLKRADLASDLSPKLQCLSQIKK